MHATLRKGLIAATLGGLLLSPLVTAHFNDKEIPQSYRQSWFALVASNFGPMGAMVKGEMPWDDAAMSGYADQLAIIMTVEIDRGFREGSEKGTTRAKPEIWENRADFNSKMDDLREAVLELQATVGGRDRKAIAEQVGATGATCKACHDEYKSKDYLY